MTLTAPSEKLILSSRWFRKGYKGCGRGSSWEVPRRRVLPPRLPAPRRAGRRQRRPRDAQSTPSPFRTPAGRQWKLFALRLTRGTLFLLMSQSRELIEEYCQLCTAFRKALEESSYAPGIPFPKAACGETCRLLAQWMSDHGHDFDYVTLERSSDHHSHAWLQRGVVVIDITSDQFDRSFPEVFVGRYCDHPMYMEFRIIGRHPADLDRSGTRSYEEVKSSAEDWLRRGELSAATPPTEV